MAVLLVNSSRHLAIELHRGPKWVRLIRFGSRVLHVSREPVAKVDQEFKPSALSVARAAVMFLGSFYSITDSAKEELMSIVNEMQTGEPTMDVKSAKSQELVDYYNKHSGKPPIKKFSSREVAEKRVGEMIGAKQAKIKVSKASKEPSGSISDGVKASWADPAVKAARSVKHHVSVAGTEYNSVHAAFTELKLDLKKVIPFRAKLKAAGHAEFEGHKFKLVEKK